MVSRHLAWHLLLFTSHLPVSLSSGSGSLVGIDNKIEQAMVREAILAPGGPCSCADARVLPLLAGLLLHPCCPHY